MKSLFVSIFLLFSIPVFSQVVDENCSFKGVKLYGQVQIVPYFGDFNVYISDINCTDCYEVEIVDFATLCHQWQIVDYCPDFTITLVSSSIFADFSIYIDSDSTREKLLKKYLYNQNN